MFLKGYYVLGCIIARQSDLLQKKLAFLMLQQLIMIMAGKMLYSCTSFFDFISREFRSVFLFVPRHLAKSSIFLAARHFEIPSSKAIRAPFQLLHRIHIDSSETCHCFACFIDVAHGVLLELSIAKQSTRLQKYFLSGGR